MMEKSNNPDLINNTLSAAVVHSFSGGLSLSWSLFIYSSSISYHFFKKPSTTESNKSVV